MRSLLIIFLCIPFIGFSQNSDKFNLDIARELGECYDSLTSIDGSFNFFYPLCSDSTVRVFFLEPNYYCVYNESPRWCGSAGCTINFYKKENNKYVRISDSGWLGDVDIHQEARDYVLFSDTYNKTLCSASYTAKIKVNNDTIYFAAITEYSHLIYDKDLHKEYSCSHSDSLWLLRFSYFKK
jgi:hypothetical protein